jgi:hypothetical protein
MIWAACSIRLPRSYAGQPDLGAFRAPYRTIPIPDTRWRTGEDLAGGSDLESESYNHLNGLRPAETPAPKQCRGQLGTRYL